MGVKRFFFCLAITLFSFSLFASSVLELMGASDSVHPFTARIISTGAEAAYFNPAYIVTLEDSFKLSFGMMVQSKSIDHFKRPRGYDISNSIYDADATGLTGRDFYASLATSELIKKRGSSDYDSFDGIITLGAVKSIIKNWLGAALYAIVPVSGLQTQSPFFNDEREQYFSNSLQFELYGDRLQQFSAAIALGGKIGDFLRLGAGLAISTYTVTKNQVFVPNATDPATQIINSNMSVGASISPYFSFVSNPVAGFHLTGTFHFPTNTGVVELNNEMQVWGWENYEEGKRYLKSSSSMTAGYQPMKLSIGTYYDFDVKGYKLTPMASFEWSRWSTYINRHGEKPRDNWNDIFSGTLGFSMRHEERKAAFGLIYIPTPVPAQTGRENYVDNDRIGFSLGYTEYFHVKTVKIGGGISGTLQWLLSKTEKKSTTRDEEEGGLIDEFPDDSPYYGPASGAEKFEASKIGLQTNNPGFPGWKSGGFVMGIGVSVEVIY